MDRPDLSSRTAPGAVPSSVLVVGAGLAGSRTVLELRERGFTGHITVVGAERVPPYDRPPLSKHLLDRPAPAWLADELGTDALAAADDVRLSTRVEHLVLSPDGRVGDGGHGGDGGDDAVRAVTADGSTITAGAVVVATGARALRPPAWASALTLHTAADADVLRARLAVARTLVIVGAGWIGAEVATVAAAAGIEVTVVEAGPVPLGVALGPVVGGLTAPWYATEGITLLASSPVAEVDTRGVTLHDGLRLRADVVLSAVGVRPATQWLSGTLPLTPDGAVAVDATHTPVGGPAAVRVVGDAARRRSTRHGWVAGGHWDAALRGPAVAVASLLGQPLTGPEADPAPYVFSTQLGHELALYGQPRPGDDLVLRGDPAAAGGAGWSALWFTPATDELTAVFTVDRPRDVARARRLFAGEDLPRVERAAAADPGTALAARTH